MVVVQYILPALRMAIARELVEGYDLRRTEVAERMEVTPAAVTQYLNRTRGDTASDVIGRSSRVMALISEIAGNLAEGETPPDELLMKVCKTCRVVRIEEIICELHKEAMPSLRQIDSCACSLGLVTWDERMQEHIN
jgi:predicted transcriptional regulator